MDFTAVSEALRARGFAVSCFARADEAAAYLNAQIDHQTVGLGGSITIEQMGLYDSLAAHNDVHWHWRVPEGGSAAEEIAHAATAQVYLCSVNGLSANGEIVNIDGNANRVSAALYGHKRVFFLAGANKIAPDYDAALDRARNIAAPLNAQRLGLSTPCTKTGHCHDCRHPQRICRALSVLWEAPRSTQFEVVLVDEPLGY